MIRSSLCNYSDKNKNMLQQKHVSKTCLNNFWRTLGRPLINCEFNLILTWSENCFISSATEKTKFPITDTKVYVPVVNLSAVDNVKLLKQLQSGFERTINLNK